MKFCTRCKLDLHESYFGAWRGSKDQLQANCKPCMRARNRARYYSKKPSINRQQWERQRERYIHDAEYRLQCTLRARLRGALRRGSTAGSAVRDLGCTIAELKAHLERQFQPGMTWENYGDWHIDHKRPLTSFDLTDRRQFLRACHYTNLQPLWAEQNLAKGALY
jgi:hypothetical protein